MSSFPERLKELMKRDDVSLREVARQIGVSNSLLSKYQNGIHEPKMPIVKSLAAYFNVSTEYMSGSDDVMAELQRIIKIAYEGGLTGEEIQDIVIGSIKLKNSKG